MSYILNKILPMIEKHNNVDLFIDNITNAYHGTDATFDDFNITYRGTAHGYTPSNMAGVYFTDNIQQAYTFGKKIKRCFIIYNNTKIVDAKGKNYGEYKHKLNDILDNINKEKYDSLIVKNYKDCGKYGNVRIKSNQYIIFNEDNILTEEILRDLFFKYKINDNK